MEPRTTTLNPRVIGCRHTPAYSSVPPRPPRQPHYNPRGQEPLTGVVTCMTCTHWPTPSFHRAMSEGDISHCRHSREVPVFERTEKYNSPRSVGPCVGPCGPTDVGTALRSVALRAAAHAWFTSLPIRVMILSGDGGGLRGNNIKT